MRLLRRFLPPLLLVLVALLVPLGLVASWADSKIDDTDRYVSTMEPLAADPEVQKTVATRLTGEIMKQIDLGPLQDSAERLLGDAARSFTGTEAYRTAWNTVSRVTHDAFRDALAADQGSGDAVTLDLAPVTAELKQQLKNDGVPLAGRIPVVHTDLTLLRTDQLDTWRTGYHFLAPASRWVPPVAVLLTLGAILIAVRGRRLLTTALAGLALVVGALLLALLLAVAHNLVLSNLPEDVGRATGEAVYSTVTASLRSTAWVVGAVGLVLAVLAGAAHLFAARRDGRSEWPPGGRGSDGQGLEGRGSGGQGPGGQGPEGRGSGGQGPAGQGPGDDGLGHPAQSVRADGASGARWPA